MAKSNSLQAVLDAEAAVSPEAAQRSVESAYARPSREGTAMIGGHFPPAVKKQLRILAAEEDTTSQALLAEALDLLFAKKGKRLISDL